MCLVVGIDLGREVVGEEEMDTREDMDDHPVAKRGKKEIKLGVTLSRLELETFSIPNCASIVRPSYAASRRCDNQLHHSAEFRRKRTTLLFID